MFQFQNKREKKTNKIKNNYKSNTKLIFHQQLIKQQNTIIFYHFSIQYNNIDKKFKTMYQGYHKGPAYTYTYNQNQNRALDNRHSPNRNSINSNGPSTYYNHQNGKSNNLSQMNERLTQDIEQMKRRNEWKRQKQRESGYNLRKSWGSVGKGSRISIRSWDNNNHHKQRDSVNRLKYQTDTESMASSRASNQILNRPIITHSGSYKEPPEPPYLQNSPSFNRNYGHNIAEHIRKNPIIHPVQQSKNNYYVGQPQDKIYVNDQKIKIQGNFNKRNQYHQHNVPYFNVAKQERLTDSTGKQYQNTNARYPKEQQFQQFLDMNLHNKKASMQSIPSRQFQDFDDSTPNPQQQSPYSPLNLILPSPPISIPMKKRESQRVAPQAIANKNNIKKQAGILGRVQGMISQTKKSYDGMIFIYLLIAIGVVLVTYQIIK